MTVETDVEMPSTTEGTQGATHVFINERHMPSSNWLTCPQTVTELWRRVKLEFIVEWPLLLQRWKIILFGIVMQYVHGIFTQLAHRMHQPLDQPLHDVGFDLTPELGPERFWVSEAIFGTMFAIFVVWTFSPFFFQRKRFYTAVMWSRLLMVLVTCQVLRIITFSVTQLPGPSYHCRAGEPTAHREWPTHWSGHVVVDVGRQVSKSCGDLIFSSHTTFILTGILAYNEYGSVMFMKVIAWIFGVIMSALIIASRKHYTVDIVIAWYTVPLVFYMLYRRWTTRRPMSEFLGGQTGTFDDVDGVAVELEQVLVEKASGESKPLLFDKLRSSASKPSTVIVPVSMMNSDATAHVNGANGAMVRPRSMMTMP